MVESGDATPGSGPESTSEMLIHKRIGDAGLPRLQDGFAEGGKHSNSSGLRAVFKQFVPDFQVVEVLPFEPSGEGEHVWLQIRKRLMNTHEVIAKLAKLTSCRAADIGYSGLKDRHAVTTQWFSLPLAGCANGVSAVRLQEQLCATPAEADGSALACELLTFTHHQRKLRHGTHSANRFCIILRDCAVCSELEARLELIRQHGFPNYFGEQRFGLQASNLLEYQRLAAQSVRNGWSAKPRKISANQRRKRSLAFSAARALMFNAILAKRIEQQSVAIPQPGEPLMLAGTQSFFCFNNDNSDEADIEQRLREGDVATSGPLWGELRERDAGLSSWQQREFDMWQAWAMRWLPPETQINPELLIATGHKFQRRRLLVWPQSLQWTRQDSTTLELDFSLPTGSYATSLLKELCELVPPVTQEPRAVSVAL